MSESLQVAVRVRPLNEKEREDARQESLTTFGKVVSVRDSEQTFSFTEAFGPNSTQGEIFSKSVLPLLPNLFRGFNLTILAYGQTGSGKTYTMGTCGGDGPDAGMITKSIAYIFNQIKSTSDCEISVSVSFLELYMEEFRDLLATANFASSSPLDIREDATGSIVVPGLTEIAVASPDETLSWLAQGSQYRKTGATAMNVVSSRSHAVFTIKLECKYEDGSPATVSKFSLVDLAGSERAKKTGTSGERMQEGIDINKGLLALGNVISALSEQKKGRHIPYRDSKLTRLLQDSLGGNSHTLMIACVSSAPRNLQETLSTLRYATRALKIKNKPVVNADLKAAEISELQTQVKNLRNLLEQEKLTKARQLCPPGHQRLISLVKQAISDESDNETIFERIKCSSPMTKDYLRHIGIVIDDTEDEQDVYHSLSPSHFPGECPQSPTDNVTSAEAEQGYEQHQMQLNMELQDIESELESKEAQMKELSNMSIVEYEEKCLSLQQQVEQLQLQKCTLEKQLEELLGSNSKASAMLAEQRRQQIKELERKISLQNRELAEIARLRQEKKRDTDKITGLNKDIQGLKAAKVKLAKEIKKSAENYRTWKLRQDREVGKLKEAAVKGKHQLDKQARLHARQQNVLQRKYEEALAANKRLQSMIGNQRHNFTMSTTHRSMLQSNTDKLMKWLLNEKEIEKSKAIHREALDHLLNDKDRLTKKKTDLLNIKCWEDPSARKQRLKDMRSIDTQINTLDKQIIELEKLVSANAGNNTMARWTVISNLSDARFVMENLLQSYIQADRELAAKKEQMNELEETTSNENKKLREQIKQLTAAPEKEEVVAKEVSTPNQPLAAANPSRTFNLNSMVKSKRKTVFFQNDDDLEDSDADLTHDDIDKDPDWRNTPFLKLLRSRNSNSDDGKSEEPMAQKKISFDGHKCKCSGNCDTNRCGCKKNGEFCSENCVCKSSGCQNRLRNEEEEDSHEMLNSTPLNTTFEVKKRSSSESNIREEMEKPPRKRRMFSSVKIEFDL
ncbi:chromosome-associated kinesin KIF4 isoform X2 [Neocloeon triangulifer]|uniref:chromosome-associated kinesin KIF4 isoform X2 n=1 Tax=Neocloeon triangulifer TaxID=2078957 RepID=UPI00286F7EFD|nr:chromosome-associated kinesin KIF4 isoform X2 [Neocloeon triangulifer]